MDISNNLCSLLYLISSFYVFNFILNMKFNIDGLLNKFLFSVLMLMCFIPLFNLMIFLILISVKIYKKSLLLKKKIINLLKQKNNSI
jgi:hypothetical protein